MNTDELAYRKKTIDFLTALGEIVSSGQGPIAHEPDDPVPEASGGGSVSVVGVIDDPSARALYSLGEEISLCLSEFDGYLRGRIKGPEAVSGELLLPVSHFKIMRFVSSLVGESFWEKVGAKFPSAFKGEGSLRLCEGWKIVSIVGQGEKSPEGCGNPSCTRCGGNGPDSSMRVLVFRLVSG